MFSSPKVSVERLFTEMYSIVLSYCILLVKHGIKNSETTSSLSDLYSCFNDRSRNANGIKVTLNYLSKPAENKMLPPGFEPGIIGLRSQYAWPDYTTGA